MSTVLWRCLRLSLLLPVWCQLMHKWAEHEDSQIILNCSSLISQCSEDCFLPISHAAVQIDWKITLYLNAWQGELSPLLKKVPGMILLTFFFFLCRTLSFPERSAECRHKSFPTSQIYEVLQSLSRTIAT